MSKFPQAIKTLIRAFTKFPGIGPKTAARFVFYLLSRPKDELNELAANVSQLKEQVVHCTICQNFSQNSPCEICADPKRDHSIICIVAKSQDFEVLEKTNEYQGTYHILGGTINPLGGIGPEHLKIQALISRIKVHPPKEIILALNPDMEGETTAMYLTKLLKQYNIPKVTRLARGLPVGSDLEYADEVTLSDALKGRREI
ncbi:recombination mediator RecR [Patescibacteria group bacterium]|nr:recombination mediator RecR [Patescibacteria group bacterium]